MKGIEYAFTLLILYSFQPYLLDHFLWIVHLYYVSFQILDFILVII